MIDILITEVVCTLIALGYKTPKIEFKDSSVAISFMVTNGSESFLNRHKKLFAMLCGGYLSEFYYINDTQYIYLNKECDGLEPDDNKYSTLINQINHTNVKDSCEIYILDKSGECKHVVSDKNIYINL